MSEMKWTLDCLIKLQESTGIQANWIVLIRSIEINSFCSKHLVRKELMGQEVTYCAGRYDKIPGLILSNYLLWRTQNYCTILSCLMSFLFSNDGRPRTKGICVLLTRYIKAQCCTLAIPQKGIQ